MAYGCTLDAYAASKNLPLEFLTSDDVALEDGSCYVKALGREVPAVEIPYADQSGERSPSDTGSHPAATIRSGGRRAPPLLSTACTSWRRQRRPGTYYWSRVSLTVTSHGTEVSRPSGCPGWITGEMRGLSTSMASPRSLSWSSRMKPVRSCGGL
jgi:hypothetical protein